MRTTNFIGKAFSVVGILMVVYIISIFVYAHIKIGHTPKYDDLRPNFYNLDGFGLSLIMCIFFLRYIIAIQLLFLIPKLFKREYAIVFIVICLLVNIAFEIALKYTFLNRYAAWFFD